MKKLILLIFFIVSIEAKDIKEYIFLGNHNIVPIVYNENNISTGLVVDLMKAIAKEVGIKIKIKAMDWREAQEIILNDKADALLYINSNPQRDKIYNFSKPLLKSDFSIFYKSNYKEIQNISSLYGKTVAVESRGYPIFLLKKKYPKIKIKIVSSWEKGFELIQNNMVDALIVDKWIGEYILSVNSIQGISILDKPIESSYSRIAVKKENIELLNKINIGLDAIDNNGIREKILDKWTPKEIVYLTKEKYANLNNSLILSLIFIFIIFIAYIKQRKLKRQIETLNSSLEERIQQEVAKNTKQLQILQQQTKMAQMGEMIGAIAHQWRQPLNVISAGIQNLKYDYQDGYLNDEKFVKEFIDKNKDTIGFMSKTIDDFRTFFRIDKEKIDFKVKKTTESVVDMLSAQLKDHFIEIPIEGDEFEYCGLENEYKQVVLNIINNAKDALVEKNIENPKIEINITQNRVIIQDNAGGIPEEILERVFEPYFTTKEQGKGTGMGLYMSKMIIEDNMGGELSVKNIDSGAMFTIDFNKDN